jgi:O-antigen/teichoic acid export membrane protein
LEGIFLLVAVMGGAALYAGAGYIASDWLKAQQIPLGEVQLSLEYMALTVALRWMSGLYRGAISGYERLVWLSGFNALIASLRFVAILPILIYFSHQPTTFFAYQLAVSVLEITGLMFYAYSLFPSVTKDEKLPWEWASLKPVLKFSLTIAFTSSVWVLVTQTDKLVLSKILSLADYGDFTLAVLLASGIMIISGPISSSIMPRMAKLEAVGDHLGVIKIYRDATQLMCLLAGSASVILAFFAEQLIWVWTGDRLLAYKTAPILKLYAFGNGVLAISAFPYYLQYAKGNLHLHLIGNALFIILFFPVIILVATRYGGVGAGYVWLTMNSLMLALWVPFVHHRLEPNLHKKWFFIDVLIISLVVLISAYLISNIPLYFESRWEGAIDIAFRSLIVLILGLFTIYLIRCTSSGFKNKNE